ncbi:MAG: PIN domain-containing protein [Fimbriimonas sp.]
MRINYVLVDYENVKAVDLRELDREDVRVIVFLGSNQLKLPSDLVIQMQALGDRGEYVQACGNGPNALDFHIAFTIGERCAGDAPSYFHIISNDVGFDPLLAYLKRKKIFAGRYKCIADLPLVQAAQPKTSTARAEYVVEKLGRPNCPRPRTTKTLSNCIRTMFQGRIVEKEIEEILTVLHSRKFVVTTDGKVSYPSKT